MVISDTVIVALVTTLPATLAAAGAFYLSYKTLQQGKETKSLAGTNLAATKQDLENAKTRVEAIQNFVENETPDDVVLPDELLARIPATQVGGPMDSIKVV